MINKIEIRVLNNGKPEIYCDGIDIKSFEQWKEDEMEIKNE